MTETYFFKGNQTIGGLVAAAMAGKGIKPVKDVADANLVFTYFTAETDLEDAYFDSEGLVQVAAEGTYLIDLSPSSPNFAHELYAVSAVSDLHFVAAPLVVVDATYTPAFDPCNVLLFVGAEEGDVSAVAPVLEALGRICVIGEAGEAQLARAAQTLNHTARIVAAVETEALYRAVGMSSLEVAGDLDAARAAMPNGDYREVLLSAIVAREFSGDYTIEMLLGEIAAAQTAADDAELILPQLEAAMSLVELLDVIGGQNMAPAAMALLFVEEEEGKRAGLEWSRAQEVLARPYDEGEDEDECGCGCGHHHHHDHDHDGYGYAEPQEPVHGYGFDPGYDEDERYGFDRFDYDMPLGQDDDEDE